MRFSLFAVFFVIAVYCVAPSHQYGTMFADHITPAFNDETDFQGIKTFESFTTDASIGVISAHNVAGFSINTPGPVTSHSNTVSMVASQGIEFGATELSVHSAGSLSLTGQRIDFDSGVIDFSGAGDIIMGGIKSQVRSASFTLDSRTDLHLSSSGSTLDINAPVGVFIDVAGDAQFNANNNIELLSRSGEASFSGASLSSIANFIDIDGEVEFSADARNAMNLSAGAIAEFASVGAGSNTFDNMNVDVSSGDIVLDAAGILSLTTDQVEDSSMLFSAVRNTFVVSRSAAESVIRIDSTEDFAASARNRLTFGTFNQESDLSFSGQSSTSIGADTISVTTTYGDLQARNDLSMTSLLDMTFSVTAQDISATSATGNIEFLATAGSFSLNTNDDFVTSSSDAFIDTQDDINVTGGDVSFRQNNIDANGALRIDTASDFEITTGFIEYDTSGTLDFTMGGEMVVDADRFVIAGSKASSTVEFNTDGVVTLESRDSDITFRSDMFLMETNRYIAEAPRIDIDVDTSYSFLVGDTITLDGVELTLTSQFADIAFSAGDSYTVNTLDVKQIATNYEFEAGNEISMNAPSGIAFSADSNFGAEIEGKLSVFAPSTFSLQADRTTQLLQRTFDMTSNDIQFLSGESIYHAQNLPSDEFQLFNVENIDATGSSISFISGGDFSLDSRIAVDISGDTSFNAKALNALTLSTIDFTTLANGFIGVHSGGELFFDIEDSFQGNIENDLIINGPNGEHGLVSFDAGTNFNLDAIQDDIDIEARSVSINTESHLSTTFDDQNFGIGEGELYIYSRARTAFDSMQLFNVNAGGPISIFGRDEVRITTQSITNLFAQTAIELRTDILDFNTQNSFNIASSFKDAKLTFEGDHMDFFSGVLFDIQSSGSTSFYSGNTLDYSVVNNIDITSDAISFEAPTSFTSTSQTLSLTSDDDTSFLSGGDMLFHFSGAFVNNVIDGDVEFETSTFRSTTSLNNNWLIANGVEMNAADGVVSHFAENFGSYTAGTSVTFHAQGSIYHDTGSLSFTGLGVDVTTNQADGNMIFDATTNRINMNAGGTHFLETEAYANFYAFGSIIFESSAGISVLNGADFDFFSEESTRGTIGGDMTFTSGASGHFEAGNRVEFDASLSFQMNAGGNFLVSTGEQGSLSMESTADFSSTASIDQYWVSSGDFSAIADLDVSFTTGTGDISLFTVGGIIEIESDASLLMTVEGDTSITSGEMISISSTDDQIWTSNFDSISSTAAQGNIVFDLESQSATFEATNNMLMQSKGSRDPTDGLTITAASQITFFANNDPLGTFNVIPQNYMTIGGDLRPTVNYLAGGSPTLAGITVGVNGDIITHADIVQWNSFELGGVFTTDVGGNTHITSEQATFTGTTGLSVTADSDIYLSGDQSLNDSGTGFYSATATGGLFKFSSIEGGLQFHAQQTLNVDAKEFRADIGNFQVTTVTQTDHTFTGDATYSTTVGKSGSLEFQSVTDFTVTSGGAQSWNTLGLDAPLTINSATGFLNFETQTSGDITFKSAADMEFNAFALSYTSASSITIDANSNRGADLTEGTIDLIGGSQMVLDVGDSLKASAHRNIELFAPADDIFFTARDISFNSADNTLMRIDDFFSNSDELIFQNSVGGGGDVNIFTNGLKDEISITTTNGITWNLGQNVLGYAFDETTILADSQNNKEEALTFLTTADRGDMYFTSNTGTSSMTASDAFTIDTNVGGPGVIDAHSSKSADFVGNGLNFVSQSGDIEFLSMFGEINILADEAVQFMATGTEGRVDIEAHGVDSRSEDAIFAFAPTGNFVIGAPLATVNIDAWESIELFTSVSSSITIGHVPEIDISGGFVVTGTGTTSLLSSGPDSDIVFNVLDSQHGLGSVTLLAGNKDTADAQIDFVTTENLSFVSESGLTFAGFNELIDTDRPADIFFVAVGVGASIQVATEPRAVLSNIEIDCSSVLFDADNELYVKSGPSRTSATSFVSDQDRVKLTVESADDNDSIFVSGYEGDITFLGRNLISMIAEGDELTLRGRHGMKISALDEVRIETNDIFIDGGDGDVTMSAVNDILMFVGDDLIVQAGNDINMRHSRVSMESDTITFTTRTGNIFYNFGSLLDIQGSVEFEARNGLTIPMREESIIPGSSCFIQGEFMIAHNNFYYDDSVTVIEIENFKDTGVMICYCAPGVTFQFQYYCRPLADTYY